ncbi:MAG TPA: ABC transporter ATP-binding protein [Tepidisphaeraceae bacterium]|jgi:putative ABC transport system ATP-binding protein|nr:ABC transporter ATP-binding protein [Tepidisphaeraceae bacterium]
MPLIISNLAKTYVAPDGTAVPVVRIENLRLEDGEQVALIGSSGSGKTTLLHLIAGILAPDSGVIVFGDPGQGDVDITGLSEANRDIFRGSHIGYVFQTHHLLPGFTALENVLLGMSFTGRPHDPQWARHLLKEVGLADRLNYKPEKLSVGQQQRVAVARALANRPRLVLADEPTGALDPKTAHHVLDLIRNLCKEVGASLLLVTHDLSIAGQFPRTLNLAEINTASTAFAATNAV